MRVFKGELRAAIRYPGMLPRDGLPGHVRDQDGGSGAFLSRLWRDLYGEEPAEAAPAWDFYWKRHPDGPFATLISTATTYLHPAADDLESLQRLAKRDDDYRMEVFKAELRQAIRHPEWLPGDELSEHVQYDDGSVEAFLDRLWRDLYGDEPARADRAGTRAHPGEGTGP